MWNNYQEEIFKHVLERKNIVVVARAGVGKSTTILEAGKRLSHTTNASASILYTVFNKRNQMELQEKITAKEMERCYAKTFHSIGLAALKSNNPGVEVNARKLTQIMHDMCKEDRSLWPFRGKTRSLVSMAKNTLTDPTDISALAYLAEKFDYVYEGEFNADNVARFASRVLTKCLAREHDIDFDDMIWFPAMFSIAPRKFDVVFIDEAQDLNAAQLALVTMSIKPGGQSIYVGDDKQAIYGWRGASQGIMNSFPRDVTLALPITYRCPKSVVKLAQNIVPDYTAHEDAPQGGIIEKAPSAVLAEAEVGDLIISRTNAALFQLAVEFLSNGRRCRVLGKDITGGLIDMIEQSKAETVRDLLVWSDRYLSDTIEKYSDIDDEKVERAADNVAALKAVTTQCNTIQALKDMLSDMGVDEEVNMDSIITLSTVHKIKGAERNRVWVLANTFRSGGEESNLWYVAVTRTKDKLFIVS